MSSKYRMEEVDADTRRRHQQLFKNYVSGIGKVEPGGWVLLPEFRQYMQQLHEFKVESSDVLVMTFPKCGTTWMQEIVWTMRNNSHLDHPLSHLGVNIRVPFIDTDFFLATGAMEPLPPEHSLIKIFRERCPKDADPAKGFFLQMSQHAPHPRTIKTHLPISLLPNDAMQTCKVIYVSRNPKDVLLSYLHHSRLFQGHNFRGTTEDFVDIFLKGEVVYGPYWNHIKEGWAVRDLPNVLFVRFEDLLKDLMAELRRLNTFLGTNLKDEQLEKIAKYTSFAEMKKRCLFGGSKEEDNSLMNDKVLLEEGGFFRKGKSGGWKKDLTPEQIARIDNWIAKNTEDTDFDFDLYA